MFFSGKYAKAIYLLTLSNKRTINTSGFFLSRFRLYQESTCRSSTSCWSSKALPDRWHGLFYFVFSRLSYGLADQGSPPRSSDSLWSLKLLHILVRYVLYRFFDCFSLDPTRDCRLS